MPSTLKSLLLVTLMTACLFAQTTNDPEQGSEPIKGKSRTETVDEVWRLATQGELLSREGWSKVAGYFTTPAPFPGTKLIQIMSNDWGPAHEFPSKPGDVELGYIEIGTIDSHLQFKPAPETEFVKTAFSYHMVAAPAYMMMYGPDGKTLVEKKPVGYRVWQIQGSLDTPWTTINTAIRYVLERRDRTTDPTLKKNADKTIAELLKHH